MADNIGFVQVRSAQEVSDDFMREQAEAQQVAEIAAQETITALSHFLSRKWEDAKRAKEPIEDAMLANMRQRAGEYDPVKLGEIKSAKQPEIFMNITATKCRNAVAWIKDILFSDKGNIFSVDPTPIPELPDEVVEKIRESVIEKFVEMSVTESIQAGQPISREELNSAISSQVDEVKDAVFKKTTEVAKKLAEDIERKIDDDWVQGGFYSALTLVIDDIVSLKAGIIKGPIFRKEKVLVSNIDPTGRLTKSVQERISPQYERRSPFRIFPSPRCTSIANGEIFDVINITPTQLYGLIGVEGFSEKHIRNVLREFRAGSLGNEWLGLSQSAKDGMGEDRSDMSLDQYPDETIACLEYWGDVPGDLLIEWGLDVEDEDAEYPCCVWQIGNHVIKAMLNYDKLGRKPYYKTSFQNINDSFWGEDVPDLIADAQQVCNACARSILANLGIGSLPQIGLNVDRLEPNATRTVIPGKVWPFTDEQMASNTPPVIFWQPTMNTEKLMNVYAMFSKVADDHSGVPAYAHGDSQVGGAGNALADYEEVLTPNGPVKISELKVGDEVCNTYGSFSKVTGVYPQGETDIFRLYFSDGRHVDCDKNHRWSVRTHHGRKFRTLTTEEIVNKGLLRKTIVCWRNPKGFRPKWMLPIVDAVEFSPRDVSIDPYTMGALIGDGDARCRVTTSDMEVFDNIPYPLGKIERHANGKTITRCVTTIKGMYHAYGLNCKSIDKFIPVDYLYNTREVRMELLRGLMDTDGCSVKAGGTFFSTSSLKLANDFVTLVRSLGGTTNGAYTRSEEGYREFGFGDCLCQKGYCVIFNLPNEKLFKVERKQARVTHPKKRHVYITGVKYLTRHSAICISVDADDKLFICANGIPTHNTSSGLSMLIAQASRGIKAVIRNIDNDIISRCAQYHYDYILDNQEIFGLFGDYQINARGSDVLLAKEQQAARKVEYLATTANPIDLQLIGLENRRKTLFSIAKDLGIELDESIPREETGGFQQQAPPEAPRAMDDAGNPAQGVDDRQFNQKRIPLPVGGGM